MARRKRRFHRTAPDRGWIVGTSNATINFPDSDPDSNTAYYTLFDFADIDPEALTGRIEQDKSDWFVKRVILNLAAQAVLGGTGEGDTHRFYEWAVGTIGTANAEELNNAGGGEGYPIIGPEAYNLWSRQFQSGVNVCYHTSILPYASDETTGRLRLAVDSTDASLEAGWVLAAPFFGAAMKSYDFTVSNAGLRNNQECGIAITQCQGPLGATNWDGEDFLAIRWWYQILVQKRRT